MFDPEARSGFGWILSKRKRKTGGTIMKRRKGEGWAVFHLCLLFFLVFSLLHFWVSEQVEIPIHANAQELLNVYSLFLKYLIEVMYLFLVSVIIFGICSYHIFTHIKSIVVVVVLTLLSSLVFVLVGLLIFYITIPMVQHILCFLIPISMVGLCFFWKLKNNKSKEKIERRIK